ncbi:PDGLE domain-containing protein [Desulforamulus putei]|uniref:PDGLE domain-containing protein n=2 Tax=Desulforamulus putei TaxID=74701 RepID=UPI002FDDB80C
MNKKLLAGLFIALLVAVFLSPFASPHPDGLERVAEDLNFIQRAEGKEVLASPIPDYSMPGIKSEFLATGTAGAIGVVLTFGLIMGMKKILVKKQDCSGLKKRTAGVKNAGH